MKRTQSPSPLRTPRTAGLKFRKQSSVKQFVYTEDKRTERFVRSK